MEVHLLAEGIALTFDMPTDTQAYLKCIEHLYVPNVSCTAQVWNPPTQDKVNLRKCENINIVLITSYNVFVSQTTSLYQLLAHPTSYFYAPAVMHGAMERI